MSVHCVRCIGLLCGGGGSGSEAGQMAPPVTPAVSGADWSKGSGLGQSGGDRGTK